MKNRNIANTDNFFEIEKDGVLFWGKDIVPRKVALNKRILKLSDDLKITRGEIVEIYDDETIRFFQDLN